MDPLLVTGFGAQSGSSSGGHILGLFSGLYLRDPFGGPFGDLNWRPLMRNKFSCAILGAYLENPEITVTAGDRKSQKST